MVLVISIGFFALVGFAISGYILWKKQKHEKLVCFMHDDCNKVVESRYSSLFFGVPNEVMGLGYYATALVGTILLFLGVQHIGFIPFLPVFLIGTGVSALFALYLIYVQYAVLKEWCEYCVASALASIAVFVLSLLHSILKT